MQLKNGSVPQYYTNRALCSLKLGRWDGVVLDCRSALELDNTWVKGHFFLGQALMEKECYEEAIKHLQRGTCTIPTTFNNVLELSSLGIFFSPLH